MNQKERLVELLIEYDTMRMMRNSIEACAEHLLEQGVVVPPCKVDDTVYAIFEKTIKELYVKYINIYKNDIEIVVFPKDENKF